MADSEVLPDTYIATCDVHGEFTGKQLANPITGAPIRMGCPACAAERKAASDARRAQEQEAEHKAAEAAALDRKRRSGIPPRYDGKTLASFSVTNDRQQIAVAACRRLVGAIEAGETAPNLIMAGKPGTGKSHLCCGIVEALYRNRDVRRIDLPDLIRNIRATWRRDSERSEEEVLDFYGRIDLLILEEVGTGAGTDDERARVFQVINRRYEHMLPTVIVTNLGMTELRAEMGERVIDRLREGDRALVVFDWESQRGAA